MLENARQAHEPFTHLVGSARQGLHLECTVLHQTALMLHHDSHFSPRIASNIGWVKRSEWTINCSPRFSELSLYVPRLRLCAEGHVPDVLEEDDAIGPARCRGLLHDPEGPQELDESRVRVKV